LESSSLASGHLPKRRGQIGSDKHPSKPDKITVAFHRGDIPKGTLNSIKKQAGWK
jgi:predicted RNA binding protein YcfA (HicA-like mRNA interferase family)